MDRDRFDRLSRLVAAAGTRRDALRLLLGGAVLGVAVGVEDAAARKRKRSRAGQRGKVRAQQEQPLCPTTCNQNCSNKPLHGGVNLTRCNLSERDLDGVNLRGANLTRVCFENSSLRHVNFRGANLSGTCFCGADLRGADFRGTKLTTAQLACFAIVDCQTILPNGRPALPCAPGETCCDGVCVDLGDDPNNCGACGTACGVCQFCNFGVCDDLADEFFDCNRNPLVPDGETGVCTAGPHTGICDGGQCNCGPQAVYDDEANVCLCDQAGRDFCETTEDECCVVDKTCLDGGVYSNELDCVACGPGGAPLTNLCCEYLCAAPGPGPRPKRFVCIENAVPGTTRCDGSFEGCSFNGADFVDSCTACGAS
jgi:hypothetical protein